MRHYPLHNETLGQCVIRVREVYAEARACYLNVKFGKAYVDKPDASGMTLLPDRLLVSLYEKDELTGTVGFIWVDITNYSVDQVNKRIAPSIRLFKDNHHDI